MTDKQPTKEAEKQPVIESPGGIVMPAVSAQEAIKAWDAYQDLKNQILDPSVDVQHIQGKDFKKKSYWRKVATFFNLSIETVREEKEQVNRTFVWHFTVRATAPNGRYAEGVGSCDVFEKASLREGNYMEYNRFAKRWEIAKPNSLHNVRSTAFTRAFNRAVSDLVGGGEVSAEEVDRDRAPEEEAPQNVNPATSEIVEDDDEDFGADKEEL